MLTRRAPAGASIPLLVSLLVAALAAPSLATTIHAGDSVYVNVWNHPELSQQVSVDADGAVRIPLSGTVMVGGLDETAAASKVAASLRTYVRYPSVNVREIAQGTTLFVSGGPVGVLKYTPGETLQAALADEMQTVSATASIQTLNASGQSLTKTSDADQQLRSRIDLQSVKVKRDDADLGTFDTVALAARGDAGPLLQPGDTIVFKYKPIAVRVVGDVALPGMTYLSADQSISEAISQAGGALPTSSANHVVLERGGESNSLALGDAAFLQPARNGDVLTVPMAPRVNVVGMVVTPGVVSLKADSSLLSAVYTAGGPAKFADLRYVKVEHAGVQKSYDITQLTHGDLTQNPPVQDGDTVLVPRNHAVDYTPFFSILGGIAAGITNHLPL